MSVELIFNRIKKFNFFKNSISNKDNYTIKNKEKILYTHQLKIRKTPEDSFLKKDSYNRIAKLMYCLHFFKLFLIE